MDFSVLTVDNLSLFRDFISCAKVINPRQPEDPYLADKLNPRLNPWFFVGKARLFLAVQGSRILGRIAGFIEPRLANPNHGYFGLLETTDNRQVCSQLLYQVENWLTSCGKSISIGPVLFNGHYGTGLLIEGYEQPGLFNLPVSPPYYATLLDSLGYVKEQDFFAYSWSATQRLPDKFHKVALRVQKKNDIVIRNLSDYPFRRQIEVFASLYQRSMEHTWGFTPLSTGEIKGILLTFLGQSEPGLLLIAEYHGQPAALCLTLLEAGTVARDARIAVLVVAPQFRHRGIESALITITVNQLKDRGIQTVELSYVAEDNAPITRVISAAGGFPYRRYRVYRKLLAP